MQNPLQQDVLENHNFYPSVHRSCPPDLPRSHLIRVGSKPDIPNHLAALILLLLLRCSAHPGGTATEVLYEVHGVSVLLMGQGHLQHHDLHVLSPNCVRDLLLDPCRCVLPGAGDHSDHPGMCV